MTLHVETPEGECICPRCALKREWDAMWVCSPTCECPQCRPSLWRRIRSWLAQQWLECWR